MPLVGGVFPGCTACSGTKSGLKFDDLNGNGVRDQGEPTIANWPINLLKQDQNNVFQPAGSVNTNAEGQYTFAPLDPGTYRVCEGAGPVGYIQTFPNALTPNPPNETITSLCAGPNTFGYQFTIEGGAVLTGNDFGNFKRPTKSGLKFDDLNGNGTRDQGEPTIASWPMNLYKQDAELVFQLTATTSTSAQGTYSFGPSTWARTGCVRGPGLPGIHPDVPERAHREPAERDDHEPVSGSEHVRLPVHDPVGCGPDGRRLRELQAPEQARYEVRGHQRQRRPRRQRPAVRELAHQPAQAGREPRVPAPRVDDHGRERNYTFGTLDPGTYRVCEGSLNNWIQTFPNAGTPNPTGETITNQCAGPNTFGYEFTVVSGVNITGNDFGNFRTPTKSASSSTTSTATAPATRVSRRWRTGRSTC